MIRTVVFSCAMSCLACSVFGADTKANGTCTILNPKEQPVVIGIYSPSETGIEERIISVPAKSQVRGIPIGNSKDEQFAIAYKADVQGDVIRRSTPIKIIGHSLIRLITQKRHAATPDVLIEFRGFDEGSQSDQNSLVIPRDELHARMIIGRANQKVETIDSPLATVEYSAK